MNGRLMDELTVLPDPSLRLERHLPAGEIRPGHLIAAITGEVENVFVVDEVRTRTEDLVLYCRRPGVSTGRRVSFVRHPADWIVVLPSTVASMKEALRELLGGKYPSEPSGATSILLGKWSLGVLFPEAPLAAGFTPAAEPIIDEVVFREVEG